MAKIKLQNGMNYSVNGRLWSNLEILLNDVKQSKMDLVIVLDGAEGTGKSFMARGIGAVCAAYLGVPFGVNDIHFDLENYMKSSLIAAKEGQKHKINVLDEARKVINRARGGTRSNIRFTNYLSECRALGQVHIILAPAFHDLDRYLVLWRMSLLIHSRKNYVQDKKSETGVKLYRGEYMLFVNSAGGKKALSTCWEMKGYKYPHKWEMRDRWSPIEVFSPEQVEKYEKNKFEATMSKYYNRIDQDEEMEAVEPDYLKVEAFAKKISYKPETVRKALREGAIRGRKFRRTWLIHKSEAERLQIGDIFGKQEQETRKEV